MIPVAELARLNQCHASYKAQQAQGARPISDSMQEGITAHWYLQKYPDHCDTDGNGFEVTDEMVDGADLFHKTFPGADFSNGIVGSLHPMLTGKIDHWEVRGPLLVVAEYAFGHRHVEVKDNLRLIASALAILKSGEVKNVNEVEMVVIQPRHFCKEGPVRRARLQLNQVLLFENGIIETINHALGDGPKFGIGSHCTTCAARATCSKLGDFSLNAVDLAKGNTIEWRLKTIAEQAKEYTLLCEIEELLKARISGLNETLLTKAKQGSQVPGYALQRGEGRLNWSAQIDEVKRLAEIQDVTVLKETLITPNQAVKAGFDSELMKQVSERKPGAMSLVKTNEITKRYFK